MREKHSLEYLTFVFLIILVLVVDFTSSLKDRPCIKEGPCTCVYANGSKIDISELSNHHFEWVNINSTARILYTPCTDVITDLPGLNECSSGASICLHNNQTNVTVSLGTAKEGIFSEKIGEPVSILFRNGQTSVNLICDKINNLPQLKARFENNQYVIELISPQSCLKESENTSGMSSGSVLVLLFFVLSFVYFGGGMLTLKLLRGAEGKEMIPNYEFWADLPYLVRDGIIFTLSGFQPSPSYDRI